MLKYLEVADEQKPRSVRVAHLAGKIASAAKMSTFHIENIKSAALLLEAGDLRSNLHLYEEVAAFMEAESGPSGKAADDRAKVLLKTTASLLKEVEPILANYFYHYVEEAEILDKDLSTVPMGSSIIALADLIDRLNTDMLPAPWKDEVRSLQDIRKLSGRAFPAPAVQALFQVVSPSA
jgi:HD-GYP domain-containing protein (c-di-GMP phosphodiesterase class II)